MIKNLNIVHHNNLCYYIFLSDKTLFINDDDNIKIIDKDVLKYTIDYAHNSLWICYYNINYSISIIEFNLESKIQRKIYTNNFLSYKNCISNIDSLNLSVKANANIQIIFRGWSKYSKIGIIFYCNINIDSNINIIASSNCSSYNKPFTLCNIKDNILFLICENFKRGEYILYDSSSNSKIGKFFLPNISNIYLINHNNRLLIFYNKLYKKDLSMHYREIIIANNKGYLDNEYPLLLCENILNPNISAYMGKIYIVWDNNSDIKMVVSSNLKSWNYTYINKINNSSLLKATIMKTTSYGYETLKSYINISRIHLLLNLFEKGKNKKLQDNIPDNYEVVKQMYEKLSFEYRLREQILYEKYLSSKIEYLEEIKKTEEYYKSICSNHFSTINSLINLLEEKDNIINSLLNIP
jgi:hypothetical protein